MKKKQEFIEEKITFETFFQRAKLNPNAHLIQGVICGYRIEEIENPLTKQTRYLDKVCRSSKDSFEHSPDHHIFLNTLIKADVQIHVA